MNSYLLFIIAVFSIFFGRLLDIKTFRLLRTFTCSKSLNFNITDKLKMAEAVDYKTANSVYDFTVKDTQGNEVKLDKYQGKVLLIGKGKIFLGCFHFTPFFFFYFFLVNIASKCGLTKDNYKELTELKEKYADKGESLEIYFLLEYSCVNSIIF